MSPRLEARQLQVEKGQVYSVQSHSLKTGVSEWKLEKKDVGWKKLLVSGPELNGLQSALRPPLKESDMTERLN